jgi:hypothetical protein
MQAIFPRQDIAAERNQRKLLDFDQNGATGSAQILLLLIQSPSLNCNRTAMMS